MKARDNPFRVERIEAIRYRPLATTFDTILARLAVLGYQAAIVGPEGSGKTTLLEDIQQALALRGIRTRRVFANDTAPLDGRRRRSILAELESDEVLLLDGADTVRRSAWMRFQRRLLKIAAGLVVTTHQPGCLPTLIECETEPALLQKIVADLLPSGAFSADILNRLYRRHHGNIRHCLRDLYDLAACDPVGDVGLGHLSVAERSSTSLLRR